MRPWEWVIRGRKPRAMAFVDYENWYYGYQKKFHIVPNLAQWKAELECEYDLKDIMVFGDFSPAKISYELPEIRNVTNTIIETTSADANRKKDMTDFIMLDYIYRMAFAKKEIGTFIIFTGDSNFQSAIKYLTQTQKKKVIVYGVRGAFSTLLKEVASESREMPSEDGLMQVYYRMIVENFVNISGKNILPTFLKTVDIVAERNNVERSAIHAAMAEMIEKGLVVQREHPISFQQKIRIIAPNWEALVQAGYWSYD